MKSAVKQRNAKAISIIFFLTLLAAGLLLGTESTLVLERSANGSVTAANAWRFMGMLPLISRSVANVRDVKIREKDLSERDRRSSAYRNSWGMLNVPEELVIVGDTQLTYPYREDASLIRAFLKNPANNKTAVRHPVDIRRKVASVVLLTLVMLSIVGWIWKKAYGRDPLAGAPRKVKPLPPAVGQAIFIFAIVFLGWFFTAGHRVMGPLAAKKVNLLLLSAGNDKAAGVEQAVNRGVFIDARDDQSRTALMIAARSGARNAAEALLKAGANPDLRDQGDNTALMIAIQTGHNEIAMRLLDSGADMEAADIDGRTALHFSSEQADASVLKRLIGLGANVNQPDAHGWTPIFFAVAGESADSVRSLLDAGADARKKLPDGRTVADLPYSDPSVGAILAGYGR